jgi:hypothetical protein
MVMGLAAWNLNRPGGISKTTAMQRAIEACESLSDPSVTEVAYWSLKLITQSQEIAAFVRDAGIKVRAGISETSNTGVTGGSARFENMEAFAY